MTLLPVSEVLCGTVEDKGYVPENVPSYNGNGTKYHTGKIYREKISEPHFWAKVEKRTENECWGWMGAKNSRGYGCFAISGRSFLAHRVAVVLSGRIIPDGLTIDHLCRNIVCCNPAHLDVVTVGENNRRKPEYTSRFCKRGHEYTEANTITKPGGARNCRTCHNMKRREGMALRRSFAMEVAV